MDNKIETFFNYLLDTIATSEIAFIDNVHNNTEYFQLQYHKDWKQMVLNKLQQVHCNGVKVTLNNENDGQKSTSESSEDDSASSSDESDENEKPTRNGHSYRPNQTVGRYVDIVSQCQRLLRVLYYWQQRLYYFVDLYYFFVEQCLKSVDDQTMSIALKQIASHIFESINTGNDDYKRLLPHIPFDILSSSVPSMHKLILSLIQKLMITNKAESQMTDFLADYIDIFYSYKARFINVQQQFRDTTSYFIDGDSLLLSIAHHKNINLDSYDGNTLHIIFIIERILLSLFYQSNECNFTVIFFDCHYHLYRNENSMLSLVRSCFISHLSKNADKHRGMKVKKFSSWLDDQYLKFAQDEKPMFLLYHDMSTFNVENDQLLSKQTLEKLFSIYRLFSNYHQYTIQCQLYLLNKLTLTNTTIKCFHIEFNRTYPETLLHEIVNGLSLKSHMNGVHEDDWSKYENLCQDINENDIRLFIYLKTIMDLIKQQTDEPLVQLCAPLFILHLALLIRLSLFDRHLPLSMPSIKYSPTFSQLLVKFQQCLALNLEPNITSLSWSKVADLFDGRLFKFTLYHIYHLQNISLDAKTYFIVQQSLKTLNISLNENFFQHLLKQLVETNDISFLSSIVEEQSMTTTEQLPSHKTIRISNPLIDSFLKPLISSNDTSSSTTFNLINPKESDMIKSKDKIYWEKYIEVGNEIDSIREKNAKQEKLHDARHRTKNQQKLYQYFTLYGNSMTSRDVRDNLNKIVLPIASTPVIENSGEQSDSLAESNTKKKQKPPKKGSSGKAKDIIEKNTERILGKRIKEETDKMDNVEILLKRVPNDNYSEAITLIDDSLCQFETSVKRLELFKKKLEFQRKYLRTLKRKVNLTIEEKSKLELLKIGFFGTLCEITHLENIVDAFNDNKKYMEELVDDLPLTKEKWYRFQLEKINSRLPRREQGIPDDRISDFVPDRWQVQFLDAVDKNQSVIIVAPTASGKTYASYYAMEKVLKNKNDPMGICVYIAPTKALINQVAGTIHSKFGPLFGTFTKEYEMNLLHCRILVTTPECLELLLLTPNYQSWCQRIRYCIFDEIHCMSDEIGSDSWERSMLLINCPMIGLSATVNNGEKLQNWIENVEKKRATLYKTSQSRKVCFILHLERLADLNKYLYSNRQLHPLHPIGLLNSKQLLSRGLPKDLSLSPFETLRLNEAMQQQDIKNKEVPTLTEHFSPGWVAERIACDKYSSIVRKQFIDLIDHQQTSTIDSISKSLNPVHANAINYPELKPITSLIGDFVLTLKEKNLLPCIVFTDSRPLCEELAESLTQYFEELEKQLRQTKYKSQIEALQKRLALIGKAQKSTKAKKSVKASSKRDDDGEKDNDNPAELKAMEEEDQSQFRLSGYEQDLLDGILEESTLANRRTCDRELIDPLIKRAAMDSSQLARYIKRGIAYHHPELHGRGRLAVEGLFRNRYVQIIFSTWTLALGVHMPTKTVAFVKDSIELDALQYRQSSGRAGRRGFDVEGNIVFLDIPMSKIRHLTVAAIPDIQTHITTSVTFFMRLLYLYTNAEDKKDAINRSLIALQCPFGGQTPMTDRLINVQTQFHCLHTLDFLYRLNLINPQGDLIGLAGLITSLNKFEPENILLCHLIDTKLFHQLKDEDEIVHLLSYLFSNKPWLMVRQQNNSSSSSSVREKILFNTKLSLQPLSSEILRHIQAYNSLVKEIYGSYIENVVKHIRSFYNDQEYILPYSNVSFSQSSDYDNGTFEYNIHHHHTQQSKNPSISPFAGPSGLTHEQLMSNYNPITASWDLAYSLDLSTHVVPFIDIDVRDHTNATYYLNSCILDFFKHGSEKSIIKENELDINETFSVLSYFFLAIKTLRESLDTIISNEIKETRNKDMRFFGTLGKSLASIQEQFWLKFSKEFKYNTSK